MSADDAFVEAQIQRLLQEAGLESAPFDPASFEALKRHVQTRTEMGNPLFERIVEEPPLQNVDIYGPNGSDTKTTEEAPTTNLGASPTNSMASPAENFTRASDKTDPGSSVRVLNKSTSNVSALSGPSSLPNQQQPAQARILEQLQLQTSLILQLQRRVDELTDIVQSHRQQQQWGPPSYQQPSFSPPHDHHHHQPGAPSNADMESQHRDAGQRDESPQQQRNAPIQQDELQEEFRRQFEQQHPDRVVADQGGIGNFLARPWQSLQNSRFVQLFRVFVAVRKQHVQDLPWGVLIKVVVMLGIWLTRMTSKRSAAAAKASDTDDSFLSSVPTKFYILIAVVALGLLAQTGYLGFLYKFFIQEQYPVRILVMGEDAQAILQELEDAARPDPRRRAAERLEQEQQAGGLDFGQNFLLGGRIAPRGAGNINDNDPAQPAVPLAPQPVESFVQFVADIIYLVGSFFLSIFPMWRPQAIPEPEATALDGGDEDNDGNEDEDDDQGPGQVQAPIDPAEADE